MKRKLILALVWTIALIAGLFLDSSLAFRGDVTLDDLNKNALAQVEAGPGNCSYKLKILCQDGEMTYWDYYSCA